IGQKQLSIAHRRQAVPKRLEIGKTASNRLTADARSELHRIRAGRKRWPGALLRTALRELLQPAAMERLIRWQTGSRAAMPHWAFFQWGRSTFSRWCLACRCTISSFAGALS